MPLYEYHCSDCENTFEVIQKFSDPELTICSKCGGTVQKVLSAPAIRFRGSGWYVNDYARKSSNGSSGNVPDAGNTPSSEEKSTASGKSDSSKASTESKSSRSGSGAKGESKVA